MDVLHHGYSIPFESPPPLSDAPSTARTYDLDSPKGKARDQEITEMLERGHWRGLQRIQVSLAPINGTEASWKVSSGGRLVESQVYSPDTFQDGNLCDSPLIHQEGRLDTESGPGRLLLSGSDSLPESQVSEGGGEA